MSVKDIVARVKLNQRRKHMNPGEMNFPKAVKSPRRVLVCLPQELRELTLVKQFLPRITEMYRSADITLLAMPGVKIADMFPRKGFNILVPTMDQVTWSGLAKRAYIENLKSSGSYDLVLDLNLSTSWFTSSVLLSMPDAVRVGRGNHLGQPFYNLEIKTKYLRDERNIYRSLLSTLQLLKEGSTAKNASADSPLSN